MASQLPTRWGTSSGWYLVDEVEFITMVQANGQWTTDTIGPVEIAFDQSGWLLWREEDQDAGGSYPSDKVVHIEWAIP